MCFRPLRILQFYFNAQQKGNSPIQFNEEVAHIDFQEETTKYTALITTIWDGDQTGLHLSLRTESQAKPSQGNKPMSFMKPGPKSTKSALPNLPEMISDEEAQKHARKSAVLVAKMKDGTFKAEIMENLDDYGAYTSKNMFQGSKAGIEYVQVMVVIDARPHLKINAISHKQFVEYVGTHDVAARSRLEEVPFAKEFEFRAESITLEAAEREICKTLRLKDCQAWFVNDNNLCRKRPLVPTDSTDLAGYLRYDAINKVLGKLMEDINVNQGRQAYTGISAALLRKYFLFTSPLFLPRRQGS